MRRLRGAGEGDSDHQSQDKPGRKGRETVRESQCWEKQGDQGSIKFKNRFSSPSVLFFISLEEYRILKAQVQWRVLC